MEQSIFTIIIIIMEQSTFTYKSNISYKICVCDLFFAYMYEIQTISFFIFIKGEKERKSYIKIH